jgi:outer membrane protein assembly factor BamB
MWRDRSVGKGSLTYADGNLYIQSEDNMVGLAEASPAGYKEKGRFRIADQGLPSWAHPVVSGGRLYIRNQGTLAAYDVRAR